MSSEPRYSDNFAEWLETDGLGGFASGTVNGIRTRRYHALLLTALTPPTDRVVLVNGFEAWVETPGGSYPISSQLYGPEIVHPTGRNRIHSFESEPWPRWVYLLEDGTQIEQEIFVVRGSATTVLRWRLLEGSKATLFFRPLISGRDFHNLHRENPNFNFEALTETARVSWQPYESLPRIFALHNGEYEHHPDWFRNFVYVAERDRGLDSQEDLGSPGTLRWDISKKSANLILTTDSKVSLTKAVSLRTRETKYRTAFESPLHRSADQFLVKRGEGQTIIAGYPWFTDWGRDTFISIRGLGLATGRFQETKQILLDWAGLISQGMLPNRFLDQPNQEPEYNSVDASLWYIVAVDELRTSCKKNSITIPKKEQQKFEEAIQAILTGYSKGTRFNIRADDDGLLAAGQPGAQLTWMDAKVGDWVITPRIGKPVEVQALWLNALKIGSKEDKQWKAMLKVGQTSFRERFWNEELGYLYDVVDVDHEKGKVDSSLRPNQIFAVGGLPLILLDKKEAAKVVQAVEADLWTPVGLRTLSPHDTHYRGHYRGGVAERDGAYHQGTVWPWLMGAFVEAWLRVGGKKKEIDKRFLQPLKDLTHCYGLGHLAEIADGDPPHKLNGCPFQAWSLGELLRIGK
ncbi:glycogen debranching enzyme family protein [Telmatocola sphagniphila]|uniref:Glycogen debranching enzyme family protein n=1 Tax=Telmatocola sphagniphila TaxID=1123043 RepID=A0A8E6B717_9BACT|nr:amylo-alpha-1,6-glucosidase [Telmatocola sphagniphila]QVL31580.1 glycogen debranching enzyme family protein [Telmatocola sphagniphila]